MEELLTYAILLSEELGSESEYHKRLDELFLGNSERNEKNIKSRNGFQIWGVDAVKYFL